MASRKIETAGDGNVVIGQRVSIHPSAKIIFNQPAQVEIGDYCVLGRDVQIICNGGNVTIGDWTSLHDASLVLSTEGVTIGEHSWFGQYSVLDGTGGLSIGKGVRVGMYSQIWSHVAAGEQIDGCTLFGASKVCIEDDVWLVGSCMVAPGVTLGKRTVALSSSNITKSWPEYSVLAGSPATRKESLSFYKPIKPSEQWQLLLGWLVEISDKLSLVQVPVPSGCAFSWADGRNDDIIAFVQDDTEVSVLLEVYPSATVCCIASKEYIKRLTDLEYGVLKALSGNKARFTRVRTH